jgi:hypothetical protein
MRRWQWVQRLGRPAGFAALALCAASAPSHALPVTLEDGAALVVIDPATSEGLSPWTVDGIVHVREQGFWWRVGGSGGEQPLSALDLTNLFSTDTDGDGDLDTLTLGFADPAGRFDVQARWSLLGAPFGAPTSGSASDLAVQLAVINRTASVLDFHLFQYTDVDLFGSFADDAALFASPGQASVSDGSGLAVWESVWIPTPGGFEAALYDVLLSSLGDGAPTALSGAGAAGPGDVTLAVSWSALLAPGGSFLMSQDQQVRVAPIPEPGVALLLGSGLAGLALARRGARRGEEGAQR